MSHTPSVSSRLFRLLSRLLLLLVLVYFGFGALIALKMAKPVRRFDASKVVALQPLGFQEVRFPARGGDVQLAGWYVPHAAGRHAVILVHGMSSSRTAEYRGQFSDLVGVMYRSGFAVLSLDLRGHGQSDDGRLSFSINEHRDVLGAYDYLRAQGYGPRHIGALGISMGGASVLAFVLSLTGQTEGFYERNFVWLFWLNVAIGGLLVIFIGVALLRLALRQRRGKFGTQLLTKLAGIFALVGLLPGLVIYTVSYQFVSRSIATWFDVEVATALDAGLALGKVFANFAKKA